VRRKASRASAYREFEIHSGRRAVATRYASSAQEAAIDYVRSFGSSADEIRVLGPDTVSWRGARFVAVPVLAPLPDPASDVDLDEPVAEGHLGAHCRIVEPPPRPA
jgi:hypothetical protein